MLKYYKNCTEFSRRDTDKDGGLSDMINDAKEISRRTLLQHVDRQDLRSLESALGYEAHPKKGLTMAADWHVAYYKGRLFGDRVYFFKQSAIEYIFK